MGMLFVTKMLIRLRTFKQSSMQVKVSSNKGNEKVSVLKP